MKLLGPSTSRLAIAAALALAFAIPRPSLAGDACKTKVFKTQLVTAACTKGGQNEAKNAMKAYLKQAKLKSCNECHTKLAPNYELKPDAVQRYGSSGGK